jgi:zinc D-Ala-D-Ala carboxypeptidase
MEELTIMSLSRYFSLDELTHSNTAKAHGISNQPSSVHEEHLRRLANAVLDPLREAAGGPIKVTSGYRSPELNAHPSIRGSKTSQHSLGQAADLQPSTMTVLELFKLVVRSALPYDQVIYEAKSATSKWVHVSHSEGANRGEIRVAQFDANGNAISFPLVTAEQALAMSEPRSRGARKPLPELVYEEGADEPEAPAPKPTPKAAAKTTGAKKPAAKKVAAKEATAKKPATKQAAAKKVAAKKVAPRNAAVKQAAPIKVATKRPSTKRAAAKKAP